VKHLTQILPPGQITAIDVTQVTPTNLAGVANVENFSGGGGDIPPSVMEADFIRWAINLLRSTYATDGKILGTLLQSYDPVSYTFVPNGPSLVPGYAVAKFPFFNLLAVCGTTSDAQLIQQAVSSQTLVSGPINGQTSSVWMAAANSIFTAVAGQYDPTVQTIVMGHSYGAVVAALIAQLLLAAGQSSQWFGMGTPKIGTQTLVANMAGLIESQAIAAVDDPVCSLPPGTISFRQTSSAILAILTNWSKYQPAVPSSLLVSDSNPPYQTATPTSLTPALQMVANYILSGGGGGLQFGIGHFGSTYYRRFNVASPSKGIPFVISWNNRAFQDNISAQLTAAGL